MASAPDPYVDPAEAETARQVLRDAATGIIDRLKHLADEQVRKRATIEERWLEDLRAFHGRYDVETENVLSDKSNKRSRAFVKMTRAKTNAWEARLSDLLFPADDRNWGISPTPVPSLTRIAQEAAKAAEQHQAEAQGHVDEANRMQDVEGQGPEAIAPVVGMAQDAADKASAARTAADDAHATMDEARKRSEAMAHEIDDQLTECQWPKRARKCIRDAVRMGPGVVKGPLTANRPKRRWTTDGNVSTLETPPDDKPEYRRVDPWTFFPDMDAEDMESAGFTFERHLPNKKDLRRLTRTLDFDKDAVRRLLVEGPALGTNTDLRHLDQLRTITGEGEAITGRYILWEYHGPLECEEIVTLLKAIGRDDDAVDYETNHDPLDEMMVVIHFCDGELLKMADEYVMDSNETLYSVFAFEEGEASIMGALGVPRIMMDSQAALNGAWRMMLDNAALSVGPQVVIDKTQVEPEDASWKMAPRKIWLRKGQEMAGQLAPFQTFNIPMNQAQLAGIIELALKFVDEETGLPMIAQGEQGEHITQTAGGMAMLFNSANVVFRRVVKAFDDMITVPVIRRLYDWNMQFNENEAIKGDMQTEARGTSVLLVREVQSQNLMAIATGWSTHPVLGVALKAYDAMRMALQALSINPDDILLSKAEYEAKLKTIEENAQGQESPDVIRAKATVEAATITAKSRTEQGQNDLQIAEIRNQTALVELATTRDLTLEQLKASLAETQAKVDSTERQFAAKVAVEDQRIDQAAKTGIPPQTVAGTGIG